MTTPDEITRVEPGDVVDLILEDHRRFEALLRELRVARSDRDGTRRALAALHVAHAEAEERFVYPSLRRAEAIDEHEAEHGAEEHAEGHQALLAVLQAEGIEDEEFDELVEGLATALNHHLTEEELTILNPARDEVEAATRARLGEDFARERNAQLEADCGRLDNVRRIVQQAERGGLLDDY